MFDVSFFELIIIGLIALLVLGPTKLLEVARFSGRWLGRIRRQFNDMKSDIDRELQLEEMRTRLAAEERALRENLSINPVEPSIAKPVTETAPSSAAAEPAAADAASSDPVRPDANTPGSKEPVS